MGGLSHWVLGVAKEPADWRPEGNCSPEHGLWSLVYTGGKYTSVWGEAFTVCRESESSWTLTGGRCPSKTHVYTREDAFTEKLLLYFLLKAAKAEAN